MPPLWGSLPPQLMRKMVGSPVEQGRYPFTQNREPAQSKAETGGFADDGAGCDYIRRL